MKKFLFIAFFGLCTGILQGNIAIPQAYLSELTVPANGNWTIELGVYDTAYWNEIDSIKMVTTSGSSLIINCTLIPGGGGAGLGFFWLSLISQSNLVTPLSINPAGDIVKLISYSWGYALCDSVIFGNIENSFLDCLLDGESIIKVAYINGNNGGVSGFCIDQSPTIGFENDTTGAIGVYRGIAYRPDGSVFTAGFFSLPDNPNLLVHFNPDGSFSERVLSRKYTFDIISLYTPPWPWTLQTYSIEPVDFCLRPNTIQDQNIVAIQLITSTDENPENTENNCIVAPNPFTDRTIFYFNLHPYERSGEILLVISCADGKTLERVRLSADQKSFEWNGGFQLSPGILFYQLSIGNRIIQSGRMIKI